MRRINTLKTLAIVVLAIICAAFTSVSVSMLNVAKAETTSSQAANVVLDMNGIEANLETNKGVNTNVDNVLNSGSLSWGIFPEATGATKMMFTKDSVAAGETLKISFNKAYKASDLLFVKIRIATNPAAGVTEAYSLADSGCTTSAGTLTSGSGVNNYNYYLDPAKLADADGYISGIILKRTSGEASSYYFNYVELRTNSTGFDMDGEEAVLTAEGEVTVRADNTFNNTGSLDWGMFPEATGATKLSRTESNVAVGKTVTVKFASPIKAAANKGINVRLATENFQCVLQGYSLGDTAFVYSASVVKATGASVSNFNVVMPSEILADSDGYVRGFVIKNVSGSEGRLDFDYVNVTEISSKYDLDGTEATIESAGGVQIHADNTFNTEPLKWGIFPEAEGKTKLMRTAGGINEGETFDITFAVPMKAESGKAVRVRMASENAHGVTAGYALSDSSAEKAAGWKAVGGGNVNFMLVLDSVALADGDGYIRGIRIKRTSGSSVVYDVDYVELGDAEDIKLDMDLTEAWFESGGVKLDNSHPDNHAVLNMFNGDGSSKITWTDEISEGGSFNVKFGNKVSAALYPYLNFRVAVGNWSEGTYVVSEIYSLSGKLVGSFTTGYGNVIDTVMINTARIADSDGFAEGFTVKKASGAAGQYFADYVELLKDKDCVITVRNGEETTTVAAKLGATVKVSELKANDGENDKVVGYKINGKLYSADYSFTLAEDVEIEVVRLAFKMRVGASIRRVGVMGLRFIVDLDKTTYENLQAIVGSENVSLGIAITKKDNGRTVEKTATNRIDDGSGNIIYCGVVTGIPETSYKTQFSSQAFADIVYADGSNRVYAIENDNVRSVYDVAVNALASGTLSEADRAYFESVKNTADENASTIQKINLPDYDSKKTEYGIDISGWLIPKNISTSDVDWITEAGINIMHAVAAGDSETLFFPEYNDEAKAKLNFFRDKGIQIYVNTCSRDATSFQKISSFGAHGGVIGMSYDEPTKAEIDEIAKYVDYFNRNGNGKNMLVNLFPSFASSVKSDFGKWYNTAQQKYELYLQYYCDNVLSKLTSGEKWLSADRYLLTYDKNGNKCIDSGWLADVQSVAKVAKNYGAKTNFFIQTMPFGATNGVATGAKEGSRDRVPTYNDIRLQQYALMAFGYDGISLFCYGSPIADGEFASSQYGMIDRNGNKTEIYDAVKQANNELLSFDHVLKQFAWQGVFTCDAGKTITGTSSTSNASFKSLDRISLANVSSLSKFSASADTLCGYFKDAAGNDGIMVVNYNETTENLTDTVELTFDSSKYNAAVCYVGGVKKVFTGLTDGKLSLSLGAGEGIFVIPYAE